MKWLKRLAIPVVILLLLALVLIKPIDRSPLEDRPFYRDMMSKLDSVQPAVWRASGDTVLVSWSKVNITPSYPMPMAGYKPRDHFESVHDSLYCSILHIQQGQDHLFMFSADLILFPPALRDALDSTLGHSPHRYAYYSATHTHSSLGGWDNSLAGSLSMGDYSPRWVQETVSTIRRRIHELETNVQPATLTYLESDASGYVENRLSKDAPVDPTLRALKLVRNSGDSALIYTFSGHATLVNSKSRDLSADYPGAMNRLLREHGYGFAMYMAGMVGSHRVTGIEGEGFEKVENIAQELSRLLLLPDTTYAIRPGQIEYLQVPLSLGPSQLRISDRLAIRDWIYRWAFHGFEGHLTGVRMGALTLLSTPCDFSGELYVNAGMEAWLPAGHPLIITSFNGDYIGYITEDAHYDREKNAEVRTMNWVGPYYGKYFEHVVKKMVGRLNDQDSAPPK